MPEKRIRGIPHIIPQYPADSTRGGFAPLFWAGNDAINAAEGPWSDAPTGSIYARNAFTSGGLYYKVADTGAADDWYDLATDNTSNNNDLGVYNVLDYGALGDGVTDDSDAIQAAIDAACAAGAGVVYLPPGTYILTKCLEIINHNHVTLAGAGIGLTVLDSSATVAPPRGAHCSPGGAWGVVQVESTIDDVPVYDVNVRDLTVKTSTSPSVPVGVKVIFYTYCADCTIERVHVDGARNEAIYKEARYNRDLDDISTNWCVRNCIVENHHHNGININDSLTVGAHLAGNWIHDGFTGIGGCSEGCIIEDNRIERCNTGIAYINESPLRTVLDSMIVNNILLNCGSLNAEMHAGILVITYKGIGEGGLLVANNIISGLTQDAGNSQAYGILVRGTATVRNNILRGVAGPGTAALAISCEDCNGTGAYQPRVVLDGNRIEAVDATANRYAWGIFIQNDADVRAIVTNNIIEAEAINETGNFYGFYDAQNNAIYDRNLCNARINFGGLDFNNSGEYNNQFLSKADFVNVDLADNDTTPSVKDGRMFNAASSNPTTITMFDDGVPGQVIFVRFYWDNVTIDFSGTHLKGHGGVDWTPATGDHMMCYLHNSGDWMCICSDNTA